MKCDSSPAHECLGYRGTLQFESVRTASLILCRELNRKLCRNPRGRIEKVHDKARDEGNRSGIQHDFLTRWSALVDLNGLGT